MSRLRRQVARAALIPVLATPIALMASASAFAIGSGFNPLSTPPVFPGTTTPAHAWKLVGTGGDTGTEGASSVQVAPRWIVSSAHGPLRVGQIYTSPLGVRSKVIAEAHPTQELVDAPNDGLPFADISLALLETAIPAPPGGFPTLLTERLSFDLKSALPGYVLWAGQGGTPVKPAPTVGWSRADGLPSSVGPRLSVIAFDSGSTEFLYPSPGARPINPGVTDFAASDPWFGGASDVRYSAELAPSATETYPTVAAWMRAKLAEHPEATPPELTNFAGAGVDLSRLAPPAPRGVALKAATPTSLTAKWTAPTETRIPITGYRIRALTSGKTIVVAPTETSGTITGLSTGVQETIEVRAINANGVSGSARSVVGLAVQEAPPEAEATSVTYATRNDPGTVRGFSVTAERASKLGADGRLVLDYCVTAKWDAPTPIAGTPITRYETTFDGVVFVPSPGATDTSATPGADGKLFHRRCGFAPASVHTVSVRAFSDLNAGPPASGSATVPSGAALGTVMPAVTGLTSVPRRSIRNGTVDYCTTTTWQAPPTVDGAPVSSYVIRFIALGSRGTSVTPRSLSATTRSHTTCGLQSSARYQVYVAALYDNVAASTGGLSVETRVVLNTPTGPDAGSSLPGPKDLEMTPRLTRDLNGKVDYCVQVRWSAPDPVVGFSVLDYDLSITSADLSFSKPLTGLAPQAGVMSRDICGLKPTTTYTVWASARYQVTDTMTTFAYADPVDATTPSGAAPGTLWPAPTAVTATVVTVGTGLCADIAWQAPTLAPGMAAPTTYGVITFGSTFSAGSDELPGTARNTRVCDLPRGKRLTSSVYASFGDATVTKGSVTFTTPA